MALGLYKPGQGYWARVMTATMVGVLTLATAAWLFQQMGVVADKLPKTAWVMSAPGVQQPPAAGEKVTLLGKADASGRQPEIGTATVRSYNPTTGELTVTDPAMAAGVLDPTVTKGVAFAAGGASRAPINGVSGRGSIEPFLLQGLVAGAVLLIGAVIAYWMTALNRNFVEFLIAVDGEMKKVNWSTVKDIRSSTMVVVFAALLLSASLFVVDFSFQWFFRAIGVLMGDAH
jgi:preprotein translocase SecE subunit